MVTAVNDAPVAVDDTATTAEDTALDLTQTDLKGNDTDVDNANAELSVTAVNNATNGSVALVSGMVTFTPTAGFVGTAGFDYTVSDGSETDNRACDGDGDGGGERCAGDHRAGNPEHSGRYRPDHHP